MADMENIISAIEKAKKQSEKYAEDKILVSFEAADRIIDQLKETEKMLEKACETLAEFNPDFICEVLLFDYSWCEDHCIACSADVTNPECVKRYLKKQIEEDEER